MRIPGFIRLGMLAGLVTGTSAGVMYVVNHAYHDNQTYHLSHGQTRYTKVDGIYAHTILTKGDPKHGRNSIVLEKKNHLEARIYIGENGCSSVDQIIIEPTFLNEQERQEYKRGEQNGLKESFFQKADLELQEHCNYFMKR